MSEKKERLQFYIDPEANRQLNYLSKINGISKAELIREGVAKILKDKLTPEEDPAYKLIGLINDKDIKREKDINKNIATDHDLYLYGDKRPDKNE